MNAEEKSCFYNLLKCASSNYYGYNSPDFSSEKPDFSKVKANDSALTPDSLNKKILSCTRCSLNQFSESKINGRGVTKPYVMIIEENESTNENNELLNKMLSAIDLSSEYNCYITSLVKCRSNLTNYDYSILSSCKSLLDAEIFLIKPKYILGMGKNTVKNLMNLREDFNFSLYRGKITEYNKIPLIFTYHSSNLTENPELKRPAWEDLKLLKKELLSNFPDYSKNN